MQFNIGCKADIEGLQWKEKAHNQIPFSFEQISHHNVANIIFFFLFFIRNQPSDLLSESDGWKTIKFSDAS